MRELSLHGRGRREGGRKEGGSGVGEVEVGVTVRPQVDSTGGWRMRMCSRWRVSPRQSRCVGEFGAKRGEESKTGEGDTE